MNDVTPDNASFFNLPDATGAIVSQVTPDSPAGHAGLKSGDVLREIDGSKIVNGSALQVAVSEMAPGNTIALGILRDGKPETVKVTVGEFHAKERSRGQCGDSGSPQHGKLGLAVDELTPDLRQQLNIPEQVNGAAVESVRPASPADDAGLAPGDVILEVNRHPVQSADKFVQPGSFRSGREKTFCCWSGQRRRVLPRRPSRPERRKRYVTNSTSMLHCTNWCPRSRLRPGISCCFRAL